MASTRKNSIMDTKKTQKQKSEKKRNVEYAIILSWRNTKGLSVKYVKNGFMQSVKI